MDGNESILFAAMSANFLPIFMISNLMTGLVGFLFDTIHTSDLPSMIILSVYVLSSVSIAIFFREKQWKLKFW